MAQKRTNYGQMYSTASRRKSAPKTEETTTAVEQVEEPKRTIHYKKATPSKIRIRKGPGMDFEHNGKYVVEEAVEIVEVENGFGLLSEYVQTRDGWVSLEFFKLAE